MSSRVVVMSPRPGRIARTIEVDLARPRDEETRESERYFEVVTQVREALRGRDGHTDPDTEAVASARRTSAEGAVG
jgi:ABC-type nitrate/sulfonate/bicarbonate transport system ATPase subunit